MRTKAGEYVLTSEGWKPAPMVEYEPPKWYHKLVAYTLGLPLLGLVKCLECIERRLKHE